MADLTYAQLKQAWLDNAKGTTFDTNDWASTMAAVATADKSPAAVSTSGVQQLATQGAASFPSFQSGAYRGFVNTATTPAPVGDGGGAGAAANQAVVSSAATVTEAVQDIAQTTASECAWKLQPFGSGGGVVGFLTGHPSWCVLTWSQIRAIVSAGILVGGLGITLAGVGWLLSSTSAGQAIIGAAKRIGQVAAVAA